MGVNMLECQVQRGVTLEVNAMVNGARIGFSQPTRRTPAFLSHLRQPSHRSCRPNYKAFAGTFDADTLGGDAAASRAGRPRSSAGVLVRRSPASQAGSAVPLGQPPAKGEPAGVWCCAFAKDKRRNSIERVLPWRMPAFIPLTGSVGRALRPSTRGKTAR
jgi:hypothetical protein